MDGPDDDDDDDDEHDRRGCDVEQMKVKFRLLCRRVIRIFNSPSTWTLTTVEED